MFLICYFYFYLTVIELLAVTSETSGYPWGYPWVSAALFSTDFTTFSPTLLVITLSPSGKGAPNGTTLTTVA